jgi:heme oxygenase
LKDAIVPETAVTDDRIAAPHPFVPPLLAQLRAGTRDAHDRIEAIPGQGILLAPELSAGAYIAALKALYAFQAGLHKRLPPLLRNVAGLNWPEHEVLQALAGDLTWFGIALPRAVAGPRMINDSCTALGALYLLEGSQLGGRIIGKAVAKSLSVSPGRGGSFFCGRTADNARNRWQAFCTVLAREGELLDAAGCARVVAGAQASFAYLEAKLGGSPQSAQGVGAAVKPVAAGHAVRTMN